MAVAVSVLSGKIDAGIGIMAAARAVKLDFIPVAKERYDLIKLCETYEYYYK